MGIMKVKTALKPVGKAETGYFPATNTDLRTSVVFHTLTNQILVVANKNHRLYKIRILEKSNSIIMKMLVIEKTYCELFKPIIISIIPSKKDGTPHGEIVLIESQNCVSTGFKRIKSRVPFCTCLTILLRLGARKEFVNPSSSI